MPTKNSVRVLPAATRFRPRRWPNASDFSTRKNSHWDSLLDRILIGKGEEPVYLLPKYGNRHGMVAGATGTGKTVSLLVLAEGFSRLGVAVFMADVKGDVAGLAVPGAA